MTPKSISVIGLGYVGLVTAACFAKQGHFVIGIDNDVDKIAAINQRSRCFDEPGLAQLLESVALRATCDPESAILQTDITIICVGTPGTPSGAVDLSQLTAATQTVARCLMQKSTPHIIILRSTIPPGTTDDTVIPLLEQASGKTHGTDFLVIYNPEFARQGSALADVFEPSITVFGTKHESAEIAARELYSWVHGKLFSTSFRSAELLKYACNAWHGLKVAFANEIGTMAAAYSVDPEEMMQMFLADQNLNISSAYLKPGFAFGGSCLTKDIAAINTTAKTNELKTPVLSSILASNFAHIQRIADQILSFNKHRIGFAGISFKADTDDIRGSAYTELIKLIAQRNVSLNIWNGIVQRAGKELPLEIQSIGKNIYQCETLSELLECSDLIVLGPNKLSEAQRKCLSTHIVFDPAEWFKFADSSIDQSTKVGR